MLSYMARRILVMIPTLIAISIIIFIIIQLPPGDYLETYINELKSQGEQVDPARIEYLKEIYGLDKPMHEQYLLWLFGLLQGDLGYSFEFELPVSEVVGDRLWLSMVLSASTIIFTWIVAFPIGIYSAVRQYSSGDYVLTFLGFLGLATPNFLLALVLMYLANVYFGVSIGGLMDENYIDQPWSLAKAGSVLEHLWVPVIVIGTSGTASLIRRLARQPAGRAAEAVRGHRPGQGPAATQGLAQVSPAHRPQPLRRRHRQRSCRRSSPARCWSRWCWTCRRRDRCCWAP